MGGGRGLGVARSWGGGVCGFVRVDDFRNGPRVLKRPVRSTRGLKGYSFLLYIFLEPSRFHSAHCQLSSCQRIV